MSDDLQARLFGAAQAIEESAAPLDAVSAQRVHSVARRHRIQRRTTQTFVGVAAVAVVGLVVTLGAEYRTDPAPVPPAVTRTATPTPSETAPTPDPTPSSTPTGPPVRAAEISDADVLAHLRAPRTGEVWQTPVEVPDLALEFDSYAKAYRVGTRGDAEIYMTVAPPMYSWGLTVLGLYERDASGIRLIACPSAREGDPCLLEASTVPGITRDDATFYDSLTLPAKVSLGGGFDLSTTATRAAMETYGGVYGSVLDPELDAPHVETVRDLGALDVVAVTWPSEITGLTNLTYGFLTPLGSQVRLEAPDVPAGDFSAIRWDDGKRRGDADQVGLAPGTPACVPGRYSIDASHDPAQWRRAGTSAEGRPVYLPVEGGNPMASAVRTWQEANSWTFSDELGEMVYGADAGYAYPTDESFLAANALYAVQGSAGEWLLGLRLDARSIVYECA